eukprot:Colp12_sorted_trinity150504_noHs@5530
MSKRSVSSGKAGGKPKSAQVASTPKSKELSPRSKKRLAEQETVEAQPLEEASDPNRPVNGHQQPSLAKILNVQQIQELYDLEAEQAESKLGEHLNLTDGLSNKRSEILLDYYFGGLWHGKQHGFSCSNTAVLLSLMREFLDICQKGGTLQDCAAELKKNLEVAKAPEPQTRPETFQDDKVHASNVHLARAPSVMGEAQTGGSEDATHIEGWTLEKAKSAADFITSTLFPHFELYKCMFESEQPEQLRALHTQVNDPIP